MTKELTEEENRIVELYRKAKAMQYAALVVKIQQGKPVLAEVTEQIKLPG